MVELYIQLYNTHVHTNTKIPDEKLNLHFQNYPGGNLGGDRKINWRYILLAHPS